MKKLLTLVILAAILIQLCGCGVNEMMTAQSKQIDQMSEEIVRCLIEKDRDTLEELFCKMVRGTEEFDAQLDALYEFFDYDSCIRYDLDGNHAQSKSTEYGACVQWSVCAEIIYIEVFDKAEDQSRFYGITYDWTETCQEDATLVGLHTITVSLLNVDEEITVGTDRYFPF